MVYVLTGDIHWCMAITKITVNHCTCDRCGYKWITSNEPVTCASKTCRTPYWNRALRIDRITEPVVPLAEKKSVAASPIVERKTELDSLRAIMEAVQIKPKAEPHPALPVYPVEDQPAHDDSNYLQYD